MTKQTSLKLKPPLDQQSILSAGDLFQALFNLQTLFKNKSDNNLSLQIRSQATGLSFYWHIASWQELAIRRLLLAYCPDLEIESCLKPTFKLTKFCLLDFQLKTSQLRSFQILNQESRDPLN